MLNSPPTSQRLRKSPSAPAETLSRPSPRQTPQPTQSQPRSSPRRTPTLGLSKDNAETSTPNPSIIKNQPAVSNSHPTQSDSEGVSTKKIRLSSHSEPQEHGIIQNEGISELEVGQNSVVESQTAAVETNDAPSEPVAGNIHGSRKRGRKSAGQKPVVEAQTAAPVAGNIHGPRKRGRKSVGQKPVVEAQTAAMETKDAPSESKAGNTHGSRKKGRKPVGQNLTKTLKTDTAQTSDMDVTGLQNKASELPDTQSMAPEIPSESITVKEPHIIKEMIGFEPQELHQDANQPPGPAEEEQDLALNPLEPQSQQKPKGRKRKPTGQVGRPRKKTTGIIESGKSNHEPDSVDVGSGARDKDVDGLPVAVASRGRGRPKKVQIPTNGEIGQNKSTESIKKTNNQSDTHKPRGRGRSKKLVPNTQEAKVKENGLVSQHETQTPKKRGRPKRSEQRPETLLAKVKQSVSTKKRKPRATKVKQSSIVSLEPPANSIPITVSDIPVSHVQDENKNDHGALPDSPAVSNNKSVNTIDLPESLLKSSDSLEQPASKQISEPQKGTLKRKREVIGENGEKPNHGPSRLVSVVHILLLR